MTMHIQKFVDRVRGFESRGSKDYVMSMQDAKDLHADLTLLLLDLHNLRQQLVEKVLQDSITVEIAGGGFK
jgi:hypothetical protein